MDDIIHFVNAKAPALLPIFRSQAQLRLLAELLGNTDREFSISDLTERLNLPQATVSRELSRLESAGLLQSRIVGRNRLLRANTASIIFPELAALLRKTMGPPAVLAELFADTTGVDAVYIYGSWARRDAGEPGDEPADIDVLAVGSPDTRQLRTLADIATQRLGRDVSITSLSRAEWENPRSGFVKNVRDNAVVRVR